MRIVIMQHKETSLKSVHSILLAAGKSERFGTAKILLPMGDKSLLRHITEIILASNTSTLTVVLGGIVEEARATLKDLPVQFVINENWSSGQSSSIKAGLKALPSSASGVLFFLADQPFISAELINQIIKQYQISGDKVIIPRVGAQRTNPVLIDRALFPDLEKIEGDTGARALFDRLPISWFDWEDERLLLDIDKPEDYQKIQGLIAA
jgi:molybdenum cofactor cytidylyltransferase